MNYHGHSQSGSKQLPSSLSYSCSSELERRKRLPLIISLLWDSTGDCISLIGCTGESSLKSEAGRQWRRASGWAWWENPWYSPAEWEGEDVGSGRCKNMLIYQILYRRRLRPNRSIRRSHPNSNLRRLWLYRMSPCVSIHVSDLCQLPLFIFVCLRSRADGLVRYESPPRSEIRTTRIDVMCQLGLAGVRLEVVHWLDVGKW